MKRFDGYSIRGIIFSVLGAAGLVYEVIREPTEWWVMLLYGGIVVLGLCLIFVLKYPEP